MLDDDRHADLDQLAAQGLVPRQKKVLDQLLSERTPPLGSPSGEQVRPGRADDAPQVYPFVLKEALIFSRQECFHEQRGHVVELDHPTLLPRLVVQPGDHFGINFYSGQLCAFV